jgi:hypothetical protein
MPQAKSGPLGIAKQKFLEQSFGELWALFWW